jgi:LysR family nitrogen assimilation transcriptional regulator
MPIIGPDLAIAVREHLPQIMLSLVEEMSHVLVETLTRGELDYILCYDIPDLPHLSRSPLMQDDLVLVTLPGPSDGKPVALV